MYTTKQRNEIYKKAYEKIESRQAEFICNTLKFPDYVYDISDAFPEFWLVMPSTWNRWYAINGNYSELWFNSKELEYYDCDNNAKELRLNILSFCIAMTEE